MRWERTSSRSPCWTATPGAWWTSSRCPGRTSRARNRLVTAFDGIAAATLNGVWRTSELPSAFPDLDVLGRIAGEPARAVASLVDAMPGIFSADWAAVMGGRSAGAVRYASWRTPAELDLPDVTPLRPLTLTTDDGTHVVAAPLGGSGLTLFIGRTDGPAFHRIELLRLTRLLDIVLAIAGDRLDDGESGVRAATGEARTR